MRPGILTVAHHGWNADFNKATCPPATHSCRKSTRGAQPVKVDMQAVHGDGASVNLLGGGEGIPWARAG
jgi:hypothetical protein